MVLEFDDSELDVAQDEDATARLAKLVQDMDKKKTAIKQLTDQLETLEAEVKDYERTTIPDLMSQIGTNVFGIPDTDRECRIKPYYHATFPKENIKEAVEWLAEHELDGVVKNTLTIDFPRGSAEEAKEIQRRVHQMLAEYELEAPVTLTYGAHWKTYTAMVKEQHEQGVNLPLGLLNATIGQIATITKRK